LGASLIVTYKQLDLKLEDCHIRRMIEARMNQIADGNLSKEQATIETLS
jgi:putative component of toxin-antitoxin plasmid stabilization module